MRKNLVRANEGSTWAKGGLAIEDYRTSDLLKAMYDETDKELQKFRHPAQADFMDAKKRIGKGMWSNELIRKVTTLNPNVIFEESQGWKGAGAFYMYKNGLKVYTAACFLLGYVPEFTIMKEDAAGLVHSDGIRYGWRTVLQRLVQQKALTYRQVVETFGPVEHTDMRGKNWAIATKAFQI